jgi:DNA-binding NtrC family response regulator
MKSHETGDRSYADESVLLVDDEGCVLSSLARNLIRKPYRKFFVSSAAEAGAIMKTTPVTVIVRDMKMPGMEGTALLKLVRQNNPSIVRMVHQHRKTESFQFCCADRLIGPALA